MRRLAEALTFGAAALACTLLLAGSAGADDPEPSAAAGWESLLGGRPSPQLGGRWIVVLKSPSLATRIAVAGGEATEEQERAWTTSAARAQRNVIARLAFRGAPIEPEHVYLRTFNGFAASLDARALAVVEADPDVIGAYPVRAAFPTGSGRVLESEAFDAASGRRVEIGIPGFDGAGTTIALLDTGVDLAHPFLRGRLLPGLDVLDPGGDASARQNPTAPGRPERHGTEIAGLLVGAGGPAGLHGAAPGASLLPIRVAGWQPDASGGVAIYARTDQVLAGLELAVDPNQDGDAHDGARIALVGVGEPFAAFADGPLARSVAGATVLDTLVVTAAGNDGPAGPAFGSIAGPGGAPAALTVGATDSRRRSPTAHVLLRAGLRVMLSGDQPLGGAIAPSETVSLPVTALAGAASVVVGGPGALSRLFDRRGYSRIAGTAALLPRGTSSPEAVREAVAAGARAVLIDGPLPAGSLDIDESVEIPILGLAPSAAASVRTSLSRGIPIYIAIGASSFDANADAGAPAPFSSEGLAFDGGLKPEVTAPGVGMATADPGRNQDGTARYGALSGTSAAAALVAGAAAVLAQARPDLDAAGLKQALVTSARRGAGTVGRAGAADPAAAAAVELVADPPTAALGSALAPNAGVGTIVVLRNVSRRTLSLTIVGGTADQADIDLVALPRTLSLRPEEKAEIIVSANVPLLPRAPASLDGVLRVLVAHGTTLRIPWSIAVPPAHRALIGGARLSSRRFAPSDTDPAVLTVVAGRVDGPAVRPQLLPLELLEVELYRRDTLVGTLARLREVLPGRYAFGITGRGPKGSKLPPGDYELRIVATPVGGGDAGERIVPFTIT